MTPAPNAGDVDAVEMAYQTIRASILDGRLEPEAVLSQVTLARELGISRTPLREALRQLNAEGLVNGDFNRRLRVTGLDLEDFDQIYACRLALEPIALRSTAPLLGEAERAHLAEALEEMDEAIRERDLLAFRRAHREFHQGFFVHAGTRMVRMLGDLWDHSERYRLSYLHVEASHPDALSRERLEASQLDHRALLAASVGGDLDEACRLLVDHLSRTITNVFDEQATRPIPRLSTIAASVPS